MAEGTPEDVAQEPRSYTGGYLKDLLAESIRSEVNSALGKKKRASSAAMREQEAAE